MKLPIEHWLDTAGLPQEAVVAFNEAARCYKARAYRAALLFSYLGWGLSLRDRLLRGVVPPGLPAAKWQAIAANLRNEDKWDSEVFDCTQMQKPAPVFEVSVDLRNQVSFWKDRRNDCAHFKINEIGSAYVESFWQFIQSNLDRFVPGGSQQAILRAIDQFFDPNFTAPGADISPIVESIASGIEPGQLQDFLKAVSDHLVIQIGNSRLRRISDLLTLFEGIFTSGRTSQQRELAKFLGADPELLAEILRRNPSRVLVWSADKSLIRRLWRELLFKDWHKDLPAYASLLRNGLIPEEELTEANAWVTKRLNGDVPAAQDIPVLTANGFINAFTRHLFEERAIDDFSWGNRNAQAVRWYLESFPITAEIAKVISSTFGALTFPYDGRDALGALFSSNATKRAELEKAAQEAGVIVPKSILSASRREAYN